MILISDMQSPTTRQSGEKKKIGFYTLASEWYKFQSDVI